MRVQVTHDLCQTERNKMLLLYNGSGVLLSTAGALLSNRTGAGLCFKRLCVSPADKPMWCDIYRSFPKLSHSSLIFPPRGENVIIMKTDIYCILVSFSITVVSLVTFFKYFDIFIVKYSIILSSVYVSSSLDFISILNHLVDYLGTKVTVRT